MRRGLPSDRRDYPCVTDDRAQLRVTFDSVADRYQQARPEYPAMLFDALIGAAGLTSGDRLLEAGCGRTWL